LKPLSTFKRQQAPVLRRHLCALVAGGGQMTKDWRNEPCGSRPRRIPLFPRGLAYFRTWRTLRWFLVLMLPLLCSAGAACVHGRGLLMAGGILLLGTTFAGALFVDLCSRMSSSNWGTFYRGREPARFWITVVWCSLFYLVMAVSGYWG
jgi:hypothetical protein